MANDEVSEQVVLQRIRNRIIEYLEVASSFEGQREYQLAVPHVPVPVEIINMFEDYVYDKSLLDEWGPPVFTEDELLALKQFHRTWQSAAENSPDPLPPLEITLRLPEWETLRQAAELALGVLRKRGVLPEDREIDVH